MNLDLFRKRSQALSGGDSRPIAAALRRVPLRGLATLGLAAALLVPGLATAQPSPTDPASGAEPAPATQPDQPAAPEAAKPEESPTPAPNGDAPNQPRTALTRELAEQGEAELHKSVRVFQQRYLVKAGRAELQLGGGLTLADPMVHHYDTNATLLYHLSEQWAIGVSGAKYFGTQRQAFHDVEVLYGLFPEKSVMQAGGFGEVQFSPVVGKFSSFGLAVLQLDAYLVGGGGVIRTTRGEKLKPAGLLGVGVRVHTFRWMSLSVEVRDYGLFEEFLTGPAVLQHVFAGAKIGLWLPPTVQYRYQR